MKNTKIKESVTLRDFLESASPIKAKEVEGIKLIELYPDWDFMILQSEEYPEIGIAVSNKDEGVGTGFRLVFKTGEGVHRFIAPCACCSWASQLKTVSDEKLRSKFGAELIQGACLSNGIKTVLLHCWKNSKDLEASVSENLHYVDPYIIREWEIIDVRRFWESFDKLLCVANWTNGKLSIISLKTFFGALML